MGGGRARTLPWTIRALFALVAIQLVASVAVVVGRPTPARSASLLRAVPPTSSTTTTTVVEEPVLPPSTQAPAPPSTQERPRPAPAPAPPAEPAARLASRLSGILGPVRSCLVVRDGGSQLYDRTADMTLAPASTQKLLVAAAALDRLGPDFRFETTVVAAAPPHDGVVDALWLVGSGDPLLSTPEYTARVWSQARSAGMPLTPLAGLADQLVANGVRNVQNGVRGDDSRYNGPRWLPGWKPVYRDDAEVPLLSALTVDYGLDHWKPSEVLASDPTAAASAQLARLLTARGTSAAGGPNQVRPGNAVVLARQTSVPLAQIVASMLRTSDNLTAELLVRELDRKAGGSGTTVGGLAVVAASARHLGIPIAGLSQGDGSGLDPNNRVSCATLLAALDLGDRPGFDAMRSGLPIAARSGTLVHRYGGTPLAGRLAAKTGWINCAAGMVGRVEVKRPLEFALLVNGPCNFDDAAAIEDRVAMAIAAYPE